MGEGQHTERVAAPRSVSDIRTELIAADRRHDFRAVLRLEDELRKAADQATHVEGGKRGN